MAKLGKQDSIDKALAKFKWSVIRATVAGMVLLTAIGILVDRYWQ